MFGLKEPQHSSSLERDGNLGSGGWRSSTSGGLLEEASLLSAVTARKLASLSRNAYQTPRFKRAGDCLDKSFHCCTAGLGMVNPEPCLACLLAQRPQVYISPDTFSPHLLFLLLTSPSSVLSTAALILSSCMPPSPCPLYLPQTDRHSTTSSHQHHHHHSRFLSW